MNMSAGDCDSGSKKGTRIEIEDVGDLREVSGEKSGDLAEKTDKNDRITDEIDKISTDSDDDCVDFYENDTETETAVVEKTDNKELSSPLEKMNPKVSTIEVTIEKFDGEKPVENPVKRVVDNRYPLISCLSVTRGRVKQLETSIECFKAQTYPNLELVVVYEDNDVTMKSFHSSYYQLGGDERVRFSCVSVRPNKRPLGWLRNHSISEARGKYITQWDDDDWYHQDRIMYMYNFMIACKKKVVFLRNWIVLDKGRYVIYMGEDRVWEGSILADRVYLYQIGGYSLDVRGEDTALVRKLKRTHEYATINAPWLYIYVVHGGNTWNRSHFDWMLRQGKIMANGTDNLYNNCLSILDGKVSCRKGSEFMNLLGQKMGLQLRVVWG